VLRPVTPRFSVGSDSLAMTLSSTWTCGAVVGTGASVVGAAVGAGTAVVGAAAAAVVAGATVVMHAGSDTLSFGPNTAPLKIGWAVTVAAEHTGTTTGEVLQAPLPEEAVVYSKAVRTGRPPIFLAQPVIESVTTTSTRSVVPQLLTTIWYSASAPKAIRAAFAGS
jgi:hypothetical protein